ncbi:glycoside hydrolase family 3 protein [Actinomadura kijaniata]|uniref:glycoside hydrolase family 3 protein n=1 Tax=Actinomadura kijaniata TaxID=46161 RepID=UPI0008356A4B|nr:glycoside hydrolase family 3 N-terminal domain-containing protein [Actinomadura kijaniata]
MNDLAGGDSRLERLLDAMSPRDKAAQLFVLPVHGDDARAADPRNRAWYGVDRPADLVARHRPGGIVYFGGEHGNLRHPRQIAALSDGLQRAARDAGTLPLLLAADQEGGSVTRLPRPATRTPGAMALAAARDAAAVRDLALLTARELRAVGVIHAYAPVADVNACAANPVIGVRSFGSDPHLAAALTAAHVEGLQAGGVAATAKHFPGHGDTAVDSHTGVPVITHDRDTWERLDLPPLRAALDAGVASVMTGHLVVPALDPAGLPATLSRPVVTGLLRDTLGFDGVVVTDALDMRGVRARFGDDRVAVLALRAGVDLLLKPPAGRFPTQLEAVLAAVRSGELTEERLHASARRVLHLKHRLGLLDDPFTDPAALARVGAPGHLAAARRAADRAVTLLTDRDRLLPLPPDARDLLVTGCGAAALGAELDRRVPATVVETGPDPAPERVAEAVAAARGRDLVVAVTDRAWDTRTRPGQAALVTALNATGVPLVVVAVGDPYDIARFPGVPAFLATYSRTTEALRAAAATLTGHNIPRGRLPVSIPGPDGGELYAFGHPDV